MVDELVDLGHEVTLFASGGPRQIRPHIDSRQVALVCEVGEKKQPFGAGAAALLFPIEWLEPFGLVKIEAMTCGRP